MRATWAGVCRGCQRVVPLPTDLGDGMSPHEHDGRPADADPFAVEPKRWDEALLYAVENYFSHASGVVVYTGDPLRSERVAVPVLTMLGFGGLHNNGREMYLLAKVLGHNQTGRIVIPVRNIRRIERRQK